MLITFEGIDGCGKSSQAARLADRFGDQALLLREPGGTALGERLRELLKDPRLQIEPRAELLMFCAARAELVERVIRPALSQGRIVICDRYIDSTVAYQGYARGLGPDLVADLNRVATADTTPDQTFLLELDPERAATRISADSGRPQGQGDRFEDEGLEFQRGVARAYDEIAASEPERIIRIDADRPEDEVAVDIGRAMERLRGD